MDFTHQKEPELGLIKLEGEFDNDQIAEEFEKIANNMILKGQYYFVLDLSSVLTINSFGIGRILNLQQKVKSVDGKLVLKGVNGFVREVFECIKIIELFTLED